jgi:hypothetical protein
MPKSNTLRNGMHAFMSLLIPVEKSIVSRCCASSFFVVQNGNVLLLGDYLPSDTLDEIQPTQGKFILITARGDRSWDVTYDVQTLEDKTTRDEAQSKAISLVEENKNNVQYVIVCVGVNKTFANRPMYQAFAQYTYVSKEENEQLDVENEDVCVVKIYSTVDELPAAVKKLDGKKQRQFLHVWNSAYKKNKNEETAFKEAWGVVNKQEETVVEKEEKEEKLEASAAEFDVEFEIHKGNFVNGLVYGVVYEPMKEDSQGHWMTSIDIEKMANEFLPTALRDGTWTDKNHNADETLRDVEIAQSYIAPCDFSFPNGEKVTKGTWVLVSKVNNEELKKEIEDGLITGYSLQGMGRVLNKDLPKT